MLGPCTLETIGQEIQSVMYISGSRSVSEKLRTYPSPPLPLPNINPNLLSVDCRWVKGGVGTQLLECGH